MYDEIARSGTVYCTAENPVAGGRAVDDVAPVYSSVVSSESRSDEVDVYRAGCCDGSCYWEDTT